jgi:hypothetical protein
LQNLLSLQGGLSRRKKIKPVIRFSFLARNIFDLYLVIVEVKIKYQRCEEREDIPSSTDEKYLLIDKEAMKMKRNITKIVRKHHSFKCLILNKENRNTLRTEVTYLKKSLLLGGERVNGDLTALNPGVRLT